MVAAVTLDSVLRRFYVYRCATATGFVSSFLVAVLVGRGVSFTAVALGVTALSAVNVAGEVPAGYLGDRYGRRTSMVLASVLSALTATGWLFARTAPAVVALYALTGLSISLVSGATTSWLYDALDEYDESSRYAAVASRSLSLMRASTAATMLAGAGLYVLSPAFAFAASALAGWIGVLAALALPRNEQYRPHDAGTRAASEKQAGPEDRVGVVEAARAMRSFAVRPTVRTIVGYSAVMAGAVVVASRYVQPLVDDAVPAGGLVVAGTAVPAVVVLGVVGAGYTTASALAVDRADELADRVGTGLAVALPYAACALAMLAPFLSRFLPVPLVWTAALAAVVFQSLPTVAAVPRNAYLHECADSLTRATVMSAVMLVQSLVRMPVLLAAGVVADAFEPTVAVAAAGAGALVVGTAVVVVDGPLAAPLDGANGEPRRVDGDADLAD